MLELPDSYAAESSAADPPRTPDIPGTIDMPLGQDGLARLVGTSRETISRALISFRRLDILSTSHRRITFIDWEALERRAAF